MNTENAIALTLNEAWEMREASYVEESEYDYSRSIEDCLIEAGKKNGLSKNMWALLNLAMHWPNDCQCWSEDVLAGKDMSEEIKEDQKKAKEECEQAGEMEG